MIHPMDHKKCNVGFRKVFISLFLQFQCVQAFLWVPPSPQLPIQAARQKQAKQRNICSSSSDNTDINDETKIFACSIPTKLSPEDAARVMDETILPANQYDNRICYGRDAQDLKTSSSSRIIAANDPRMAFTYGEFPFTSMDQLVDLALTYATTTRRDSITMVDLGSGCGRLVLYAALTRGYNINNNDGNDVINWEIHGIEISNILHDEALRASLAGLDNGWFLFDDEMEQSYSNDPKTIHNNNMEKNKFILHLGPAQEMASVFQQADIVFAYSTVWDTAGFDETLGAIVLSRQWNELLTKSCRPGTIVITTDRCLDPNYGWKLLDRLDVDNREVMGSTGYIQILQP